EIGTVNGGTFQNYQGGTIYWAPGVGAHTIPLGAIRDTWASNGAERGSFGYPTSNQNSDGQGNASQSFQGGTLYLSSGQVSTQNGTGGAAAASGSSQLSASDQALANKLTGLGFSNADSLVRASNDTKVPLGIAAALIAKESMGQNVYGSDWGGTMAGAGQVTQQNFTNQFLPAVLAGATSNGVGPTQITYFGYFRQNTNYPWWDPYSNMCFGLNIIGGYLNGNYSDDALIAAGSLYNSGSTTGTASTYGASFDQLAVTYTQMLTS
ncbi:LGFP repeat-containing protein, partial [Propionibacterium sp.]|uniref:LGFP repeat-containing protein n=1 Tax=Propionibacterium sp. TaxID=1977903 RepID=UPI0039E7E725